MLFHSIVLTADVLPSVANKVRLSNTCDTRTRFPRQRNTRTKVVIKKKAKT